MHTVNGWTCRWLSKRGKEVLIKNILLALPTYVIYLPTFSGDMWKSCKCHYTVLVEFTPSEKRFIRQNERSFVYQERMGVSVRMIHEFNLALLAKQLWRLVQFSDSLVARVMKVRYYSICKQSMLLVHPMCGTLSQQHVAYSFWE